MDPKTGHTEAQKRESRELVGRYPEEGSITVHRVFEEFSDVSSAHRLIYLDLFDPRKGIVLSALDALCGLKDRESLPHIARLLAHSDVEIRSAAVRSMGEIGYKPAYKLLIRCFKSSGDGKFALELLKSIAKLAPDEPAVVALFTRYVQSQDATREGKAYATGYLLCRGGEVDNTHIDAVLKECHSNEHIFRELLAAAAGTQTVRRKIIDRAVKLRQFLSERNKEELIAEAAPFTTAESLDFLFESLTDKNPEIRIAAYRRLGDSRESLERFGPLIEFLSRKVESSADIEEEALLAIRRIESHMDAGGTSAITEAGKLVVRHIRELFAELKDQGRQIFSDTHELGWLTVRSKEYLEFYGDEVLKTAIVDYLRGIGSHTKEGLLQRVKRSRLWNMSRKNFSLN